MITQASAVANQILKHILPLHTLNTKGKVQ